MSSKAPTDAITYPKPFDACTISLCISAKRSITILSPQLDPAAFDSPELASALSALARAARQTQVRILIQNSCQLVRRGHRLLNLARRLPSKIQLRKLPEHPSWNKESCVIRDGDGVLFTIGGSDHQALYRPDAPAEAAGHLALFEDLWRYSTEDTEIKLLRL